MAYSRTVGELTASVRARGDYQSSGDTSDDYISDSFLIGSVADAYRETYELVATADPDRLTVTSGTVVTSTTGSYALPSDLWRLRAVEVLVGGNYIRLVREDPTVSNSPWELPYGTVGNNVYGSPCRYRLQGDHVYVAPDAAANTTFRTTYIPAPTTISGSDQVVDGVGGADQLIVWMALRDCRVREDRPTGDADAAIQRETLRISRMARDRDSGQPRRLEDPYRSYYRRRRGW